MICAEIRDGITISTHAPAGGATPLQPYQTRTYRFLLTPLREGRPGGRSSSAHIRPFLLTPLREGRPCDLLDGNAVKFAISTHAPAGGATTPGCNGSWYSDDFYSRPCGRGDFAGSVSRRPGIISTHAPAGGATVFPRLTEAGVENISTHAPAGGATAIFHKSVMRFCGKLPKDDTVLCLASFGFPRRDPKAVYLAWISCANLPQKCVRQGLALKDQGTSCFHEGLASHAFDPVLV